jgi:hypothetical protein
MLQSFSWCILRHIFVVYMFMAMIYMTWIHCVSLLWPRPLLYIHITWIHTILDWWLCLSSHLRMGMPASRIELFWLVSVLVIFLRLNSRDLHPRLIAIEELYCMSAINCSSNLTHYGKYIIASNYTSKYLMLYFSLSLSSLQTTIPHTSLSPYEKHYFGGCTHPNNYVTHIHMGWLRDTHTHANKISKKEDYSQINDELRDWLVV